MKVFSKKKYFENEWNCTLYCRDIRTRAWVDECDGKPVINNHCKERKILDVWTEDVYNPVEETGRILNKFLPNGFPKPEPKPAPEDTSCRNVPHTKLGNMRYRIIIECDGDTTLARMLVDGHTVKRVAAKRNPADKFNFRIGAQTAFNRLWEKKKKSGVREVRRRAEPGEWVKVVNATVDYANDYKNGDVLLIVPYTGTSTCEYVHYKDKGAKFLYDDEYVVLEGYKPE